MRGVRDFLAERARAWTLDLVRRPSVTNSPDETTFGPWLREELLDHPYFAARPDQVWLERTLNDAVERYAVCALVRGRGPGTVVLTGHYDVVGVENYGLLAPLAFSPEALRAELLQVLDRSQSAADARAAADLRSGDFVVGRACLDMKSGLAAGLAVLDYWAEETHSGRAGPPGNLLFIAVPDEEEGSHGMRSVVRRLPQIARQHGLELLGAINLDAEVDPGAGERGRAVFLGSVGKLLPTVLLIGRPTHAGAPFDGLSTALMLAEVVRRIELHPDMIDPHAAEAGPPPVALQLYDLKPHYDVTTPEALWCAFNLLTRQRGAAEALDLFVAAVRDGLQAAGQAVEQRAAAYAAQVGGPAPDPTPAPTVLTYAALLARVEARGGAAALTRLEELAARLAADPALDTPRVCQRLTAAAVREASLDGPAAVVGFGSLPYPAVQLGQDPGSLALRQAVEAGLQTVRAETGETVGARPFFPGVSDMSFLGPALASGEGALLRANTPAWAGRLALEDSPDPPLSLPVVNAGPWGRDYHQRTERVYAPYAFGVLPLLVWRIAEARLRAHPDPAPAEHEGDGGT